MLSILPLHRSAIGRSLGLVSWIRLAQLDKEPFVYLNSNGWDTNDFSRVNYVWVPPPVTADTTLEQLCRNVHLYPENCRIVCIIRLMMGIWRTLLMKVSDCFLTIPYDEYVWSSCNFEPLILSIILSRHSYFHYKVKYSIFVRLYERNLQRVQQNEFVLGGILLRILFRISRSLESLSGYVVRVLLQITNG